MPSDAETNSKERFSNRVDAYVKYRPSYPAEAIAHLYHTIGLSRSSVIADVGAGTGKFSELLLNQGSPVIAVEPNKEMREAAEQRLGANPLFRTAPGSAEETGLPNHSVDFIVCAQAFHWFDRSAARQEFARILKPGGQVVLIWNSRITSGTPFREAYDRLLHTYGIDYAKLMHKNISPADLAAFYAPKPMEEARFVNSQAFDYEGLSGRMHSSSYIPTPDHPQYEPMMKELRRVFDQNNQNGLVAFDYETEIYWGEL
ncbi:class I SAM-dependent methyltransferase [Paenibacillus sp. PR3]|uniref:Class I SAM-dependent methyltransferase n=1 Tax=Paenibacillus terricola TaxID=2763503 RepID=A0ABR8MNU6_9BACL|nr:class I SAM-dependent methyltransferase [Paenibacillus terricola]MBD3917683.1 class I SAM-dependent methyltransferase [Paenibacillus terricola]